MFWKSKPLWGKKTSLKSSYDAVIIGGGLHGLATAYYLAKEQGRNRVVASLLFLLGVGRLADQQALFEIVVQIADEAPERDRHDDRRHDAEQRRGGYRSASESLVPE